MLHSVACRGSIGVIETISMPHGMGYSLFAATAAEKCEFRTKGQTLATPERLMEGRSVPSIGQREPEGPPMF